MKNGHFTHFKIISFASLFYLNHKKNGFKTPNKNYFAIAKERFFSIFGVSSEKLVYIERTIVSCTIVVKKSRQKPVSLSESVAESACQNLK